jgi:peptidoglycan/LPS O-acetylase OafA/YrhL
LRGVAAVGVLLFHCSIIAGPMIAARGYLAVDFFFMLSGFVISHAYRDRLRDRGAAWRFLRQRAVRLGPIVVAGVVLGAVAQLVCLTLEPGGLSAIDIAGGALFNLALLPKPPALFGPSPSLFPGNWSLWSLFFEVIANGVWAVGFARAKPVATYAFTLVSAVALAAYALAHGDVDAGSVWGNVFGGLLRVSFGFWFGCSLYLLRARLPRLPVDIGWAAFAIVAAAFVLPIHGGAIEVCLVLLAFPLALAIAISHDSPRLDRLFKLAGEISYPLYGLHLPVLLMAGAVLRVLAPALVKTPLVYAIVPVVLALAWAGTVFYERPILNLLKRSMTRTSPSLSRAAAS